MEKSFRIILVAILALLAGGCFSSSNNQVYTSPPPRTISLDSVNTDAGPYKFLPTPDSFLVAFKVPGQHDCPVKINFLSSQHEIVRELVDSVYSPGSYKCIWPRIAKDKPEIMKYRAYYYRISICDSTYNKSFYYRDEVY